MSVKKQRLTINKGNQVPKNYLNQIIQGNCLKVIPRLPDNSVDLVVTSPPYNSGHGYDVYKDNKPHKTYIKWLEKVFGAIYPKLKMGGRLAINVGDGCNGRLHTHVDLTETLTENLKYLHMATIIWDKENVSSRTAWGSFKSPVEPNFPCPFEYILVFAKGSYGLQEKGETDLTNDEFVDWSLSMWHLSKASHVKAIDKIRNLNHPAPFPEELPTRLIKMLSWVGATVLDPFSGSGTTAVACRKLGRQYIGIEMSKDYCEYSRERLKHVIVAYTLGEF